jgi:hypothetical protein
MQRIIGSHARSPTAHKRHPSNEVSLVLSQKVSHNTNVCEYTPGRYALTTVSGKGLSQRSGTHWSASAPHMAGSLFTAAAPITTKVPARTQIWSIISPSIPNTGRSKGIEESLRGLLDDDQRR